MGVAARTFLVDRGPASDGQDLLHRQQRRARERLGQPGCRIRRRAGSASGKETGHLRCRLCLLGRELLLRRRLLLGQARAARSFIGAILWRGTKRGERADSNTLSARVRKREAMAPA